MGSEGKARNIFSKKAFKKNAECQTKLKVLTICMVDKTVRSEYWFYFFVFEAIQNTVDQRKRII